VADFILEIVKSMGYVGIALLTLLENVFPPIPSEVIMPLAGYHASQGDMHLGVAIFSGAAGSLAGCTIWYWIGRRIGSQRLRRFVERHGRWLTLGTDDIDKAHEWFQRHGGVVVFFGRLVPGLRTWVSLPAGLNEMPVGPFLAFTALGTAIWTALLTGAGYWLGANFRDVERPLGFVSTGLFVLAAVWYVYRVITYSPAQERSGAQ
jgi:membrane protein DedA with SNARE-associated domain